MKAPSYEDKLLVRQLQNNSVIAFDTLFHKYSDNLFAFSLSILKNREDSKEVVQEVFTRIWEKRSELNPSKTFKSFLFTISYNLIIDRFRNNLKDREFKNQLFENTEFTEEKNLHKIDYDILSDKIQLAIAEIPAKRQKVFLMSREEGMSQKEIASRLGISVKTVENHINLSLKHIRKKLGNDVLFVPFILIFF